MQFGDNQQNSWPLLSCTPNLDMMCSTCQKLLLHIFFLFATVTRQHREQNIQRILHGCAEIRNFSSSVEKYRVSAAKECNVFNTRREISYLQAAMQCSIYYINTNEIPSHFTTTVFSCKRCDLLCSHSNGDIFTCENDMLFSRVKISCFRAKAHLVFHWCLYNKASSFQGLK